MSSAEIRAELSELVSGRMGIADGVFPPLAFVALNSFVGLAPAAAVGLGAALLITVWRLLQGRPIRFAVAGLAGTGLAAALALRSGSPDDYFLPGIVSGALTTSLIIVSIAIGRPFVAWTSWLSRGWPIKWYWHPRVRPAYTNTSWIWAAFFALRTTTQWWLYVGGETVGLAVVRVALGWPALIGLLIATYVLGTRWLRDLGGPSVEEFESGVAPPWAGQRRGF
jgi:hypothetical protein